MNDYKLIKEKKKKKVLNSPLKMEGFHMNPKLNKHKNLIEIKNMVFVQQQIKNQMMLRQLNRTFRRLVKMILDVTESENSTSSDCAIALNEVSKTMSILEKKYQKELEKKEYMHWKKKLLLLENKLKIKLIEQRNAEKLFQQFYQKSEKIEEKGKSR